MEKRYKNKKILIVDSGGAYISIAERLAQDFGKVYYFCPNYSSCPSLEKSMVGEGLKDVKVIEQMYYKWNDYKGISGDYDFNDIDIFFFPDIYFGDLQMHLIHDCNKVVWGSRKAEELELLRFETKVLLKEIGLAVTPTQLCENYKELYEYLEKENTEKFIKLSWFRGILESAKFKNMIESIGILAALKKTLESCYADKGKNSMELLAEDPIKSPVEFGVDTYTVDGEIPKRLAWGFEIKNQLYVTKKELFENLPKQLKDTTFGLCKLIKRYGENGCRSKVSTEVRIDEKGQGHLLDITNREPSPPSEIWQEWVENISEIYYEGANGKLVEPKFKTKYAAQIAIYTPTTTDPQILTIPDEIKQYVKLYAYCGVEKVGNEKYGIIPVDLDMSKPTTEIGYVVGYADTIDDCFKKIRKYSEKIEGENLHFCFEAIEEVQEEIKKLRKLKIEF